MDGSDHGLGQGQQVWIQTILETLCGWRLDPFDISTDTKCATLAADDPTLKVGSFSRSFHAVHLDFLSSLQN